MPEPSSTGQSYRKAIAFLYELRLFGAKLGLENTFKLARLAGNPQNNLRFIHVAGTNGKGSTCAILESIYRDAGLRVGLFTSPHLVSFRERIQINRVLISEAEVTGLVNQIIPLLREFPADHHPTFFEAVTVMALIFFAEKKCDLVIWETGLGGRLDATNIVSPLATLITNIGLDHQQWLGDTLEKIAAEKAGIIKPGVPMITAEKRSGPLEVIKEVARKKNSPVVQPRSDQENQITNLIALGGAYQKQNAALAVATVEALQSQIPVTVEQLARGLQKIAWPGRFQIVSRPGGQKILLDGAHNPDGARALCEALAVRFPGEKPAVVLGVFHDKDSAEICRLLANCAIRVLLTPVHSERTEDPAKLARFCREARQNLPVEICRSLAEALQHSSHDPFVVVTGSLYLVGEAMELLGLTEISDTDEKPLNLWRARNLGQDKT